MEWCEQIHKIRKGWEAIHEKTDFTYEGDEFCSPFLKTNHILSLNCTLKENIISSLYLIIMLKRFKVIWAHIGIFLVITISMGYNFIINMTCFWYIEAFNIVFICKVKEEYLFWRLIPHIIEKIIKFPRNMA